MTLPRVLPALTVRQPWASLIALGVKRYETRPFRPRCLGPDRLLAIHAGLELVSGAPAWNALTALAPLVPWPIRSPVGAVLCVVEVEAVQLVLSDDHDGPPMLGRPVSGDVRHSRDFEQITAEEGPLGDYTPGRFAWRLRVVERFAEPVPARGRQGIWQWVRP